MLIFCTVVHWGHYNVNVKNYFFRKVQLLGFVKKCVFTFGFGKMKMFFLNRSKKTFQHIFYAHHFRTNTVFLCNEDQLLVKTFVQLPRASIAVRFTY